MSTEPTPRNGDLKEATARQARPLQTLLAVFWSFFGVRRSAASAEDVQKINPVHLILAGIASAAMFVLALVLLIKWILGSGIAA